MGKDIIDIMLDSIFDEEWMGRYGEKLTARELKLVGLLGRKGKTLRNIYVPKENGETSEVDLVYITQKGIFVFESKNYSGWIFGDEKSMYWTASLAGGKKNKFYNPVKQNRTHLKWLDKYLGGKTPLFSIIVFSERCELKKVQVNDTNVRVIKRDRTYATVRDIWDHSPDVLEDESINEIYNDLKGLTKVDQALKQAHVLNIEERYKKEGESEVKELSHSKNINKHSETINKHNKTIREIESSNNNPTDNKKQSLICPSCGKLLVLRTAKKGPNAGRQFYGCSGFPKCRYLQNI